MSLDHILVVCVGNICRSPMAAAILKQQYPQKNIDSAGIAAVIGAPADDHAITIMAAAGLDITSHVAKQISTEMVNEAELILTMSESQTKWIERQWPYCRGKVFRIGHWLDKDIEDPHQQGKLAFETANQDIRDSLSQWADKLS